MDTGRLALDIETASLRGEPTDFQNTAEFELVAVGVGYHDGDGDPEVTVCRRAGGWEVEHTATLLREVVEWCEARDGPVITYNGAGFDEIHLRNWANAVAEAGAWPEASARVDDLFSSHIDLGPLSAEVFPDAVNPGRDIPALWKACEEAGIDQPTVWYDDYDLPEPYLAGLDIDASFVKGAHVGSSLGEAYVDGVVAGIDGTHTHDELVRLLVDYAAGDIAPLFDLHDVLRRANAHQ